MAKNIFEKDGVKFINLGVTIMELSKWEKLQEEKAEAKAKAQKKRVK